MITDNDHGHSHLTPAKEHLLTEGENTLSDWVEKEVLHVPHFTGNFFQSIVIVNHATFSFGLFQNLVSCLQMQHFKEPYVLYTQRLFQKVEF